METDARLTEAARNQRHFRTVGMGLVRLPLPVG